MAKVIRASSVRIGQRRPLSHGLTSSVNAPGNLAVERPEGIADPAPTPSVRAPAGRTEEVEGLERQLEAAKKRARGHEEALAELRKQLAEERERALESGYREGALKGREEAARELAKEIEGIRALLQSLPKEQERLILIVEDAAVEIGFAAAAKIMGEAAVDHSLARAMVKQAMSHVLEREGLIIHLAPEDYRWMKQHLSTDAEGREWADVEFKANEHIGLGGCAIESRVGTLDARLELQLAALKEILLEARGRMRTG